MGVAFLKLALDIDVTRDIAQVLYISPKKNHLVIVKFLTTKNATQCLLQAKRYARKVYEYINPDLTPMQRAEQKTLRKELTRRRAASET